jgi:hypothetical protein
VRHNHELICNVLYLSRDAEFLKISNKAFKEFIVEQLNVSIDEEGRLLCILDELTKEHYQL